MRTDTATVRTKVRTSRFFFISATNQLTPLWGTGRAGELPDQSFKQANSNEGQRAKRLELAHRVHLNLPSLTLKQNRGQGSINLGL